MSWICDAARGRRRRGWRRDHRRGSVRRRLYAWCKSVPLLRGRWAASRGGSYRPLARGRNTAEERTRRRIRAELRLAPIPARPRTSGNEYNFTVVTRFAFWREVGIPTHNGSVSNRLKWSVVCIKSHSLPLFSYFWCPPRPKTLRSAVRVGPTGGLGQKHAQRAHRKRDFFRKWV